MAMKKMMVMAWTIHAIDTIIMTESLQGRDPHDNQTGNCVIMHLLSVPAL